MALKMLCHYLWRSQPTGRVLRVKNISKSNLPQLSQRHFHCNVKLQIKMFLEHENQFAYGVMQNKGYVENFSAKPNLNNHFPAITKEQFDEFLNENWEKKGPSQLFEAFLKLAVYSTENSLCISNKIFDAFIDNLTDNIKLATDDELRKLFHYLLQWPETQSVRTRNYIEVWAALDDECWNRLKRWSFDEMLNFLALFYVVNVTKASEYCFKCLQKLASKANQLTPNQLVQTMFFIGVMRKAPTDIHSLEIHLAKYFETFSVDELAVISMGFFKSKTPIRSTELISKISDKIIEESKTIHEVALAALMKIVRYSKKACPDGKVYQILDVLQHEVPRLSAMCNVHIALLGTSTLVFHKKCLDKIAMSTVNTIDQTRMKDLERLVLTYGTFNYVTDTQKCLIQKILEELQKPERLPEIEKHGRSFACCVSYLAYTGIYPVDLMNKVLSPDFLEKIYGKHCMIYGREVLAIHNTAKIFCPEAEMHRLSDKCATILAKKYTDFVPSEDYQKQYNVNEKMVLDIIKNLKEHRGGEEFVVGDHIVTHHQRGDIIVCNSHDGQPMEVKKHFSSAQFGTLRKVPDDNVWIALVIAGKYALIHKTDTPVGPFQTKIKELRSLGYHAGLVLWSKYVSLESKEAKINYLNSVINEAIHSDLKC